MRDPVPRPSHTRHVTGGVVGAGDNSEGAAGAAAESRPGACRALVISALSHAAIVLGNRQALPAGDCKIQAVVFVEIIRNILVSRLVNNVPYDLVGNENPNVGFTI